MILKHQESIVKSTTHHLIASLSSLLLLIALPGCQSTPEEKPEPEVGAAPQVADVESTQQDDSAQKAAPPAKMACAPEDENCRVENIGSTAFGVVRQGLPANTALEKFGQPTSKEDRFFEEATGDIIESWTWQEKGITMEMFAPDMTGDVSSVRAFTLMPPFDAKSERGVGIGSTEQEVLDAYAGLLDPSTRPGDTIVVGSVYGGMFFTITDGKVSSIFVGAGAE